MLQRIQYALRLIRDIYIYIFLFFIWGGWHKEITHNTQSWKVLSPNLTNKLDWDGLWDPTLGNVHVGHVECVPLAISYHLYFLCFSKDLSSYITDQWNKYTIKNDTLCFYRYFLDNFLLFFIMLFLTFSSIF